MATSDETEQAAPPAMGVRDALVVVAGLVALIVLYVVICGALGIVDVYAGFFFLFYWGSIAAVSLPALRHIIPGAVFGILLGLLLKVLTLSALGPAMGGLVFVGVLILVIFCQLVGRLHVIINAATMLFLTFAAMIHVQAHASFTGMFASLAVGIAVFVPAVWGVTRLVAARTAKSGSETVKPA